MYYDVGRFKIFEKLSSENNDLKKMKLAPDMINASLGKLCLQKHGLLLAENLLFNNCVQATGKCLKPFSSGNIYFQEHRGNVTASSERRLPTLVHIQNPITWLINKIDFKMLKTAWDSDFNENEFKRGTKQAVSVICSLISKNLWDNLRGLIARQALARLQREVETTWSEEQRRNISLEPSDIKLALTRRVHFLKIEDMKSVDVDMIFIGLKFKEPEPSLSKDLVFVEMIAKFHRNYTAGQLPNWTVTLFKVTKFNVTSTEDN